ncbi:MAG: PBSX family phage terminase large subunit, partial [Clostridia bacterium]|nr:PBSX family phage terminase large subunit [Clostridia bacterium]
KGSKKSKTTALWYIYHMMKYPDANLLCIRNVYDTHRDSTFAELNWAIRRLEVGDYWDCIRSPFEIRYKPTGQKILFRGFDDALKLASITVERGKLCWVWIEEAFEIGSEEQFNLLDWSAPRGEVDEPLFKQTTLTFNPWSEKHWLKKRFFDEESPDVGTFTTNYLCNEWLDETDRRIYEQMKIDNPRKYAVAGLGEWGISDGLIFDNWTVESFDIRRILRGPDGWKYKCVYGLDYGYSNDPTAFIAVAVNPVDKVLYIYDEHYQMRMVNSDIAAMIRQKGYEKERIRADSAEPKSNEELRRCGISRVMPAEKGKDSILHGIAVLQEYRMIVHSACESTQAELSAYVWGKSQDGNGVNKPVDRDNHLMDALRYAMADVKRFHPKDDSVFGGWKPCDGGYVYTGHGGGYEDTQMTEFQGGWA